MILTTISWEPQAPGQGIICCSRQERWCECVCVSGCLGKLGVVPRLGLIGIGNSPHAPPHVPCTPPQACPHFLEPAMPSLPTWPYFLWEPPIPVPWPNKLSLIFYRAAQSLLPQESLSCSLELATYPSLLTQSILCTPFKHFATVILRNKLFNVSLPCWILSSLRAGTWVCFA